MPDNTSTFAASESSPLIDVLLTAGASTPAVTESMQAVLQRESEFPNRLTAKLTAMALTPAGRDVIDTVLDTYWSDERHADTAGNAVSMFRLASKTAALATILRPLSHS